MENNIQTNNTKSTENLLIEKQKSVALLRFAIATVFLLFITMISIIAHLAENSFGYTNTEKGLNSAQFFTYLVFFPYLIFYIRLMSKVYLIFRKRENKPVGVSKNSIPKIVRKLIFVFIILVTIFLSFFLSLNINGAVTQYFLSNKINLDTIYLSIMKLISELTIHVLVLYFLLKLVIKLFIKK